MPGIVVQCTCGGAVLPVYDHTVQRRKVLRTEPLWYECAECGKQYALPEEAGTVVIAARLPGKVAGNAYNGGDAA